MWYFEGFEEKTLSELANTVAEFCVSQSDDTVDGELFNENQHGALMQPSAEGCLQFQEAVWKLYDEKKEELDSCISYDEIEEDASELWRLTR